MTKGQLRRFWFQIHKWIGILLAIVLIPLSVTGSALVWHDALDRAIHPQRFAVSGAGQLPASRYVEAGARVLPGGSAITQLRFGEAGDPVQLTALQPTAKGPRRPGPPPRTTVYLDPPTARVLDVADSTSGVMRWLHVFHGTLMIPGLGRSIVGWLGVLMLVSCVSGLWLWWPVIGRWTRGLRWRRAREFDTNLHHTVGFWIALPLAVLSLTGAWISFPSFFAGLTGAPAAQGRGPGGPARPLAAPALDVDRVLAIAGVRQPASVSWPTEREGNWRVASAGRGGPARAVDDRTGTLAATPDSRPSGGIALLMRRLHDGEGMGPVWQVIIFLGGIAPAALGITGIIMWLRTRRWRARAARSPRPVAAE